MGFKTLNEVDVADGTVQLIGCTLLAVFYSNVLESSSSMLLIQCSYI